MNDYSRLSERKSHLKHIETTEEAAAFCTAYGTSLKEFAKEKGKEMEESGEIQESKEILCVLIVFGVIVSVLLLPVRSDSTVAYMTFSGLMYGVIIPSIGRRRAAINYAKNIESLADRFKDLSVLKGMTDERTLEFTNDLVDRYNRAIDDEEMTMLDVYNVHFKKNPERNTNIALIMMGACIFLLIVFCILSEVNII